MKLKVSADGKPEDNSKEIHRGIWGIHIEFFSAEKGLLLYVPSTRQNDISVDVLCDETFSSTVAKT
jgi:hypothetical protein